MAQEQAPEPFLQQNIIKGVTILFALGRYLRPITSRIGFQTV